MLALNWKPLTRVVKSRLLLDTSRDLLTVSRQLIQTSRGRRVAGEIAWARHLSRARAAGKKS